MGTEGPPALLLVVALVLAGAVLFLALRGGGAGPRRLARRVSCPSDKPRARQTSRGPGVLGGGPALLLPAGAPPHGHRAVLTPEGSGVSTCSEGHRHVIAEGRDAGPVPCRPAAGEKTAAHRHAVARRGGLPRAAPRHGSRI